MANRIILNNFIDPSKRLAEYRILGGFLDKPVVEGHLSPILLEVFFCLFKDMPPKESWKRCFCRCSIVAHDFRVPEYNIYVHMIFYRYDIYL